MSDKLLTIEEAADITRLSISTLRGMRSKGEGPKSGKLGKRVFYRERDVQTWIDGQFSTTR